MGASRSILPSATSCMIVAATKVFVMLAVRTWVFGANPVLVSTSAKPAAERVRCWTVAHHGDAAGEVAVDDDAGQRGVDRGGLGVSGRGRQTQ